jgi:hypothetical protein
MRERLHALYFVSITLTVDAGPPTDLDAGGCLLGLVVLVVSVALVAILWSSRRLEAPARLQATGGEIAHARPPSSVRASRRA